MDILTSRATWVGKVVSRNGIDVISVWKYYDSDPRRDLREIPPNERDVVLKLTTLNMFTINRVAKL